jgi:hypothetical protein
MVALNDKNRLFIWGSIVTPDTDKDLLGVARSFFVHFFSFLFSPL